MSEIPCFDKDLDFKKQEREEFELKTFELHKDVVEAIVREAFQMFDEDGSGEIDIREFRKVIKSLGMTMENEKIVEMMKKIGRGYINLEEFTEMMISNQIYDDTPVNLYLENTFGLYDKDQDGIIIAIV